MSDDQYNDDDLVYVDPDEKEVIGAVQFDENGNIKSMPYPQGEEGRNTWRKFFPCGTYKSMTNVWLRKGKRVEEDVNDTLDDILPKALRDEI